MIDPKQIDFTLVLSGGGALGFAHLGVLADLEKYDMIPKEVVGTSMGGIIGACIAIGMKEKEILREVKAFSSLSKWIHFSFSGNALVDTKKIEGIFKTLFSDRKMKETSIPLKIIATNLLNGHKKVFTAADDIYIRDALLATIAIPGVFNEHLIEGKVYGDGFLCENLGVNEAAFENVLAVDVLGKNSFENEMPDSFFKTANVLEMFEKSLRILIYNQTQTNIRNSNKNICLLEPATKHFKTYHFHKVEEIRALGLGLLDQQIESCLK